MKCPHNSAVRFTTYTLR